MYLSFWKNFISLIRSLEADMAKFFQADLSKNYIGRPIALRTKRIKNPIKTE